MRMAPVLLALTVCSALAPLAATAAPARPVPAVDLAPLLQPPVPAATSCRIYCYHNAASNVSCTSPTGHCSYQIGNARDFLICDGKVTPCPPIFP